MKKVLDVVRKAILVGGMVCAGFASAGTPNIILIMSDDQGTAHFGFAKDSFQVSQLSEYSLNRAYNGDKPYDPFMAMDAASTCTPNIDKLRAGGKLFSNFHVAPSCAPTRAMLLTSSYPQRWGCFTNADIEERGMVGQILMPKTLQKLGYTTACIGKWHSAPLSTQHPLDCGFDYFFGFGRAQTTYHKSKDLVRNRESVPPEGYLTEQFTREALDFLDRQADSKSPFLLYLPFNAPHSPTGTTPRKYSEHFNTGSLTMDRLYGAIYAMDDGIGQVLEKVKSMGLEKDTLVLFTIDNGCPYWFPLPGNGVQRGYKRGVFEGGMNTPLIASWPGRVKPGTSNSDLVSVMDLFPTLIDVAGGTVPEGINGQSVLGVILGDENVHSDRMLFWAGSHSAQTLEGRIFKQNLAKKKGHYTDWYIPPGWSVHKEKWKLVNAATGIPRLYDLEKDPGEASHCSDAYPEIVEALSAAYLNWVKDFPAPSCWDQEKWNSLKVIP